jgi:tetratricopeptide (TPR) repeat protein
MCLPMTMRVVGPCGERLRSPLRRGVLWAVMRPTSVTNSSAYAVAAVAVLLASGCATHPQLGKDEGRVAVVWQNEGGGSSASPSAAPASAAAAGKDTERGLLAELREEERKGAEDLALAGTLYRLAILRRQQGEFAEAEQLYRRTLEIRERIQGPNHPDVAQVLNNLAALEAAQGKYDAAQPLLERALTIRQTALGEDDVLTAESLSNLALLHAAEGDAAAAEPLYQHALSILEKTNSPHPDELARVLDNYAALLHETGRDADAEALEARARVMHTTTGRQPAPQR